MEPYQEEIMQETNGGGAQGSVVLTRDELDGRAQELSSVASDTATSGMEHIEAARVDLDSARDLGRSGRVALATGVHEMTRADDLAIVANRVGRLSEIVGQAGVMDVAEGITLLATSEDIATLSDLIGVMSEADLESGLELARLSGELRVAGALVKRMEMPILERFLRRRSDHLDSLAVKSILQSSSSRVLAAAMAATGATVGELGEQEVVEGIVRLAASEAIIERSDELAMESSDEALAGIADLKAAKELRLEAEDVAKHAVGEVAQGSLELGAATVEGVVAEELAREAKT